MIWEIIPYRCNLKEYARKLRKTSTQAEKELWNYLKAKQINGYDFDRLRPIDQFIVDFFCKELLLVIEIDGRSHDYKIGKDKKRQNRLEELGISVLRFTDHEVKSNAAGVSESIQQWIDNHRLVTKEKIPRRGE